MAGSEQRPANRIAYARKLADPRWQKLAAEIKIRDDWECKVCGKGLQDGAPLEVHHLRYTVLDPWDEPAENLETRCANCHGTEPVESLSAEAHGRRLVLWEQKYASLSRLAVELLKEGRALALRAPAVRTCETSRIKRS